jgi:integrase
MPQQRRTNRRNNPNGYPPPLPNEAEIRFIEACGLRRAELLNLRVQDIHQDDGGRVWIHVAKQSGRRERDVPVLAGREEVILALTRNARLFPDFPERVDVQSARREYAYRLYYQLLRVAKEPRTIGEYNEEAAQEVMKAMGHNNLGIVCHYYLRLQHAPADQMTTNDTSAEPMDQESTTGVNDFSREEVRE